MVHMYSTIFYFFPLRLALPVARKMVVTTIRHCFVHHGQRRAAGHSIETLGLSCGRVRGSNYPHDSSLRYRIFQQRMSSSSRTSGPATSITSSSSSSPPPPLTSASPFTSWFRNTTVPNEGSIARDVLAAERTFLAWGRTGLGFVGAGSALFAAYHNREADTVDVIGEKSNDSTQNITTTTIHASMLDEVIPACGILIANGIFLLGFATRRYVGIVNALKNHNTFPIYVGGTLFAVMVTAAGTISSLVIVANARYRHDREKTPQQQ